MRQLSRCPICGSDRWQRIYSGRTTRRPVDVKRWHLARCSACDHGFLNPQPSFDDLADYYHSDYNPYDPSHGLADSLEATIARARSQGGYRHVSIRPNMTILDVGAGGGSFLQVAKALGANVTGVEPSPFGVRAARARGLDVFEGTLDQYVATSPARFELITFSHVVEHLTEPAVDIALAAKLLAPGGRIWIAVPNGACRSARQLGWRWHSTDLPLHLHHFSPGSMRLLAEQAGVMLANLYTFSLPKAVRGSILQEWRQRWKVPRRLGNAILSQAFVDRKAARMDAKGAGEAIVAEFVASQPLSGQASTAVS